MPAISVIVPIYNVEEYLSRCIDSILNQTFSDFELWLVDDGAQDGCPILCDEYAKKDDRVRVIHKENGGLSDARNVALERMTGEYVTFVDSDDWLALDALETMYHTILQHKAKMVIGNMMAVRDGGEKVDFYIPATKETVLKGEEILSTLNQPCAPNRLYKAELFRKVRYPVGRLYEDVFVYHQILSQLETVVLTGKVCYYYYLREGSIMRDTYNVRFTDIVDAVKMRYEWLDSINQTKLANETRLFVYSRVAVAFAHLDRKNSGHRKRLQEIFKIYEECYKVLMQDDSVSMKQKFRLWLLHISPRLHTLIFGKKIPIALG